MDSNLVKWKTRDSRKFTPSVLAKKLKMNSNKKKPRLSRQPVVKLRAQLNRLKLEKEKNLDTVCKLKDEVDALMEATGELSAKVNELKLSLSSLGNEKSALEIENYNLHAECNNLRGENLKLKEAMKMFEAYGRTALVHVGELSGILVNLNKHADATKKSTSDSVIFPARLSKLPLSFRSSGGAMRSATVSPMIKGFTLGKPVVNLRRLDMETFQMMNSAISQPPNLSPVLEASEPGPSRSRSRLGQRSSASTRSTVRTSNSELPNPVLERIGNSQQRMSDDQVQDNHPNVTSPREVPEISSNAPNSQTNSEETPQRAEASEPSDRSEPAPEPTRSALNSTFTISTNVEDSEADAANSHRVQEPVAQPPSSPDDSVSSTSNILESLPVSSTPIVNSQLDCLNPRTMMNHLSLKSIFTNESTNRKSRCKSLPIAETPNGGEMSSVCRKRRLALSPIGGTQERAAVAENEANVENAAPGSVQEGQCVKESNQHSRLEVEPPASSNNLTKSFDITKTVCIQMTSADQVTLATPSTSFSKSSNAISTNKSGAVNNLPSIIDETVVYDSPELSMSEPQPKNARTATDRSKAKRGARSKPTSKKSVRQSSSTKSKPKTARSVSLASESNSSKPSIASAGSPTGEGIRKSRRQVKRVDYKELDSSFTGISRKHK